MDTTIEHSKSLLVCNFKMHAFKEVKYRQYGNDKAYDNMVIYC